MLTIRMAAVLGLAVLGAGAGGRAAEQAKDPYKISPSEICVAVVAADESVRKLQRGRMISTGEAMLKKGEAYEFRGKSSAGFLVAISETEDGELKTKPGLARIGRSKTFQEKLDFASALFDEGGVSRLGGVWTDAVFLQAGVAMPVLLEGRPKPPPQAKGKATLFGNTMTAAAPVSTQMISSESIHAAQGRALDKELAALKTRADNYRLKPGNRKELEDITRRLAELAATAGQLGFAETAARAEEVRTELAAPKKPGLP